MIDSRFFSAITGGDVDGYTLIWKAADSVRGVYVYQHDNAVLVGFESTKSDEDWKENFEAWMDIGPGGLSVMHGFWKEYESYREEILKLIISLHPSRIDIIGHSQGGAIAELFAFDSVALCDLIKLDTLGAPRVWGFLSAIEVKKRLAKVDFTRWIVRGDIVPCLPPFAFGYAHSVKATHVGPWKLIDFSSHLPSKYQSFTT